MTRLLPSLRRSTGASLAAACLLGASTQLSSAQTTPTWAKYNTKTKTASLTIIAAYGQDTYNFDGGSNGQLTFTVPLGARVNVNFSNDSVHMPHAVEIVAY